MGAVNAILGFGTTTCDGGGAIRSLCRAVSSIGFSGAATTGADVAKGRTTFGRGATTAGGEEIAKPFCIIVSSMGFSPGASGVRGETGSTA